MRPGFVITAMVFAAIALSLFALQQLAVDTSLHQWLGGSQGWRQATQLQQQSGKPIAVFFHTEWCESCKKLKANVLGQEEVIHYLDRFIAVQINPELNAEAQSVAKHFSVSGYPSFFIVKSGNSQAIRLPIGGNTTQEQFIQLCNRVLQPL